MGSKNTGFADGLRLLCQAYQLGENDSDDDVKDDDATHVKAVPGSSAAIANGFKSEQPDGNPSHAATVSRCTNVTNQLLPTKSTDSFRNYREPAVSSTAITASNDLKSFDSAADRSFSSSSDDDSDDGAASCTMAAALLNGEVVASGDSDTNTSDEEEHAVKQLEDKIKIRKQRARKVRTQGEFLLEDLPPVEELHVSLPPDYRRTQEIGFIKSIIDTLVIVQSKPGAPALNLDSYLFLQYNVALGQIFDIFGPVHLPCYAVRFNSRRDIDAVGVVIDEKVFFAPELPDLTRFVFPHQLKQQEAGKSSDASWMNDNEPPEEHLEYSDDDAEQQARKAREGPRTHKRNRHGGNRNFPHRPRNFAENAPG